MNISLKSFRSGRRGCFSGWAKEVAEADIQAKLLRMIELLFTGLWQPEDFSDWGRVRLQKLIGIGSSLTLSNSLS